MKKLVCVFLISKFIEKIYSDWEKEFQYDDEAYALHEIFLLWFLKNLPFIWFIL